ncbi:phosphatidate cytidylyltransferase [Geodermatophilus tzadiensis]|uniref:Phosphatidate cytidylyltransferase n=1 Tax=Geodermatophilus tzadiensis TaxID=1137988 RepID=A0A2T0TJ45_9ACTN|nr:phosphatidate cytidylyltransferase [Geodermatophilus tzadiensis]PRY45645.1 phosphatidate cytidylyltransferase [Geodermatophilus tzadiensis]
MTSRPDAAGAGPSRDADTGPVPVVRLPAPPPPPPPGPARPASPPTGPRTAAAPVAAPGPPPVPAPVPGTQEMPVPAGGPPAPTGSTLAAPPDPEPDLVPPTSSRAGRNLVAAIGVGLGLGAVIIASLLVYRPAFLLVVGAAILVGVVELVRALEAGGARAPLVPLAVGTVAMLALAWTRGPDGLVTAFLLTAVAVLLWRLGDGPEGYLRDASAGVFVALYVPLLAGFAVLLLVPDDGAVRVLLFIATVVGNDVGGYTAGVLFGRHPMAPTVSPKKSWEGMAGSLVACIAVATPLVTLGLDGPWWGGVLFGAALAVSATAGDLGESLVKRDLGIKDMGTLLPGHGGIMDRLDSLLPSAAVAYLLLSWVAPA